MIPRFIHRIWLGGTEPDWTQAFASTWARPGWQVIQWDEQRLEQMPALQNQDLFDRADEIAPSHVGQLRADILRLELLWRYGGVYVDADFECLKPIDPLVAGVECFAAWVDDKWLNNALIGAAPEHPFIGRLIEELPRSIEQHPGKRPAVATGPQFLTRTWRRYPDGVTLLAKEWVYPFDWTELERGRDDVPEGAYAVHWWHNQRRERGVPCPA